MARGKCRVVNERLRVGVNSEGMKNWDRREVVPRLETGTPIQN